MGFNFNNDTHSPPGTDSPSAVLPQPADAAAISPAAPAAAEATPAGASVPVTSDVPQSAAFVRFNSCRWQQPIENGNAAFCTHREVKPYAGTAGFDAEAWCPECQYYKLRRAPKKRSPNEDYSY